MIKRISIIGPESTGKSEMAQWLAAHYQTEWVPEYARFYLDRLGKDYEQEDLLEIAKGQMIWEDEKAEYANQYLFSDTDLLVMKIWSDHKYGSTDEWIENELASRKYDLYLLADIDLIWRPDPQREHPKMRQHFFDIFKNYLEENNLPYIIVSGYEGERKKCAVEAVEGFFKNQS